MNYRPPNWKGFQAETYKLGGGDYIYLNQLEFFCRTAYEAGADDIIEQSPSISLDLTSMLSGQVGMAVLGGCPYTKVKLIFIPEEAE